MHKARSSDLVVDPQRLEPVVVLEGMPGAGQDHCCGLVLAWAAIDHDS
jgi:hypothetical protein